MRAVLRLTSTVATLWILSSAPSFAQPHDDSTAVLLDTIRVVASIAAQDAVQSTSVDFALDGGNHLVRIEERYLIWRTPRGVELVGDVSTLAARLGDTAQQLDLPSALTTLSQIAVELAIATGHLDSAQTIVAAYHSRNVEEIRSGELITYARCTPDDSRREYLVNWTTPVAVELWTADDCIPFGACHCTTAGE